jgi:hypothetical protein
MLASQKCYVKTSAENKVKEDAHAHHNLPLKML